MEQEEIDLKINSSNGWQTLSFSRIKNFENEGENFGLFKIVLESRFWDREELLTTDCGQFIDDRSISFSQIVVSDDKWSELIKRLESWKLSSQLFAMELSNYNGLSIMIELLVTENVISSPEKPFLQLSVKDTKNKMDMGIVIDQSCVIVSNLE